MPRKVSLYGFMIALFFLLATRAQKARSDEPKPSEAPALEVVVTGTRTPERIERATLHTGVVTREEAERRGASNVGEALSGELGLQVNANAYANLGSPAGVQIQGFDAERVLILQDGERVIGDFGGVVDLAAFPLVDVERIEYVAGPTSSLYGAGALGGVVNIISSFPETQGVSGRARYEVSSLPAYSFENTAAYRSDSSFGSIASSYRHEQGLKLFPDQPDLALPERERIALTSSLGTRIGREWEALLKAGWVREDALGLLTEQFPGLPPFFVDLPSLTDRYRLQQIDTWRFGSGHMLRASVNAQWFINESEKDRRDSPLDETRFRDDRVLSAEATATLADGARTWVLGVRGERETFEQRLERASAEQGEVVESELVEVDPVVLAYGAGYAELAWKLGSKLTLVPGFRFEYHRRFGAVVAPRLALAFRPSEAWQLRASAGRGFRVPTAKEYGFLFDHSFLGYRVIGNDDLQPESSFGLNAEVAFRPLPTVRLRAGGFGNWVKDLIAIDFLGQQIPGVDDFTFVNVGRATTAGFQGDAAWSLGEHFQSEVGYAFLYTRDHENDQPLASRPAHTLLAGFTFRPVSALELFFRQRLVSSAFIEPGLDAPAFITVDARLSYRFAPELALYGGVLNALNAEDDPLRPGDQRPLVGRLFVAGMSGSFAKEP